MILKHGLRSTSIALVAIVLAQGCAANKTMDVMTDEKITAPKVVAMSGSRGAWVYEIEKRLKASGFEIKRWASQNSSMGQVSDTKTDIYRESSTRFVLHIDGYAPNTKMERCYGGGYKFSHINVELIDVSKNETVFHYSNSGYSENCPPMSGTIFGDIVQMANSAWL
jgi:hypothetical protein